MPHPSSMFIGGEIKKMLCVIFFKTPCRSAGPEIFCPPQKKNKICFLPTKLATSYSLLTHTPLISIFHIMFWDVIPRNCWKIWWGIYDDTLEARRWGLEEKLMQRHIWGYEKMHNRCQAICFPFKYYVRKLGGGGSNRLQQGCIKLISVVSRIPDKLLLVRQMTKKITTKKWVQIS